MNNTTPETVSVADFTAARRQASLRMEPLACRHRDPFEHLGVADDDARAWRSARAHLRSLGLLRPEVEARITRGLRGAA